MSSEWSRDVSLQPVIGAIKGNVFNPVSMFWNVATSWISAILIIEAVALSI